MLSYERILDLLLESVHDANEYYMDMSGGATLRDYGIEPFLSARVAEKLFSSARGNGDKNFVTLENPFWEIIEESGVTVKGRPRHSLREGQKADLVVWTASRRPLGVIEMKRRFSYRESKEDIARTVDLIEKVGRHKAGSLKFGAIASFREKWHKNKRESDDILADFLARYRLDFPGYIFSGGANDRPHGKEYAGEFLAKFQSYAVVFRRKRQ